MIKNKMKPLFFAPLLCLLLFICTVEPKTVVVEFHKKTLTQSEVQAFGRKHGLRPLHQLPLKGSVFWAFEIEHSRARKVAERLEVSKEVAWHEIQETRRQYKRDSKYGRGAPRTGSDPSDPLWGTQWHLHGNLASLDVRKAWDQGITGKGVSLAIVDDGVQKSHPDLTIDTVRSKDFNGRNNRDPTPYSTDGHGTSAAGVCCALRNNGQCGTGVAPETNLVGIRLIAEPTSDYLESVALSHFSNEIDVYSNSWGPMDDGRDLVSPGRLTQLALKQNTEQGRNGKGSIYVWAGGNGRGDQDSCNYDGYANSIYTIAVGAIDHLGQQSWYSESCAALFVAAPSSGSSLGITTTDLTGILGYDRGQCCHTFGGTSSAAPAAAGAIALLLQKRPDLTWRDVQHVLAKSSTQPQQTGANRRGYKHTPEFGFGLINIERMLSVAETYMTAPAQQTLILEIDHRRGNELFFKIPRKLDFVEHVTLNIDLRVSSRSHVKITIRGAETSSVLMEPHNDHHANVPYQHTFMSVRHWGESLKHNDVWSVKVDGGGSVNRATLTIFGY